MRLILHIGTHKTGTSSLQLFCRNNRKALLEHGIFYPKTSHNALHVFMNSDLDVLILDNKIITKK